MTPTPTPAELICTKCKKPYEYHPEFGDCDEGCNHCFAADGEQFNPYDNGYVGDSII